MDIFLFLVGLVAILVAIVMLIVRFINKKPKKILLITMGVGFVLMFTGAMIGGANMTPEEKAAVEEKRLAKQEEKEEKLEDERLEKEKEAKKLEEQKLKEEEEAKQKEVADKERKSDDEKKKVDELKKQQQEEQRSQEEERMAKEKAEKAAVEKENNTVQTKSRKVIYDVFKSGDDKIDETITKFEFDENEKVLKATVKGKDGWSDKSIGRGFYEDSTAVYRELSKDNRIEEVWLTITFSMQDIYGNVEDEEVMGTHVTRKTMDKVNWKNFNYENLLDVVDGVRLYPQFVQ